jgi:hypothetical protein
MYNYHNFHAHVYFYYFCSMLCSEICYANMVRGSVIFRKQGCVIKPEEEDSERCERPQRDGATAGSNAHRVCSKLQLSSLAYALATLPGGGGGSGPNKRVLKWGC